MVGLGRDDLFLRGSRLWTCGKCGYHKNFANRCRCLECNSRPPQWILDAQDSKVRELAKQHKGGKATGSATETSGRGAAPRGGDKSAAERDLERQLALLRAENLELKKAKEGAAAVGGDKKPDATVAEDADDKAYQRKLDDLDAQMAAIRRLAKEAEDPTALHAFLSTLEATAAELREQRRAGWSVPRLLDRHRARVAERQDRVERAIEKVAELEEQSKRIEEELAAARAHLLAKQEDLAAEQAEVRKLEVSLPGVPKQEQTAAESAQKPLESDATSLEQSLLDGLRRLAAAKGGAWATMLAAAPSQPAKGENHVEEKGGQNVDEDVSMDGAGQNAVVPRPSDLQVSPSSGSSLAAVPRMGVSRAAADESARAVKQQRV